MKWWIKLDSYLESKIYNWKEGFYFYGLVVLLFSLVIIIIAEASSCVIPAAIALILLIAWDKNHS